MRNTFRITVVLSCIAFEGVLAGNAAQDAPQSYRLRETLSPGDAANVVEDFRMQMTSKATVGDRESPPMQVVQRNDKAYAMTVLAIDAKQQPTAVRLRFTRFKVADQQPGKPLRNRTSTAQGKTVTLKRIGGKTVVNVQRGRVSAEDRAALQAMLGSGEFDPFPPNELAIGEEWTLDSAELARSFGTEGTASVRGRLIDRVQKGKHPCVRARLNIEVTGKPQKEPIELTMKLEGDLYYALDLKRTLSVTLQGPVSMSGEVTDQGQTIIISGDGTAKLHYSSQWTKVKKK